MAGVSDGRPPGKADDDKGPDAASRALPEPPIPQELTTVGVNGWSADLLSGRIALSPGYNRLFGLPDDAGPPTTIATLRALYHPDDVGRVMATTEAALADPGRGFYRDSFRIVRPDGAVAWVEARGIIHRDAAGRAVRTVGLMMDITELKEREQALEASQRRLEAALADTNITLFQQDLALRYTWMHNPSWGFDVTTVIGRTDVELVSAESATMLEALKRETIESGQSRRLEVIVTDEGLSGRYDLYLEPMRDTEGRIVGVTGAAIKLEKGDSVALMARRDERRELLLDKLVAHAPVNGKPAASQSRGIAALRRKLASMTPLRERDAALLAALERRQKLVPAGIPLVDEATMDQPPLVIASGWAFSYHLLGDGARQIIDFHVPGDILGRHFGVVAVAGTVAATLTECLLGQVDDRAFEQIRQAPGPLAEALQSATVLEKAIIQQHLVNNGRRSALAGLAHLLLELGQRLKIVLLGDDNGFRCPLTQDHLADALGITPIHVNRMLRELREMDALTFRRGYVQFHDRDRLMDLAGYDPAFLKPPPVAALPVPG